MNEQSSSNKIRNGYFKIFIGYAPGVGKTYSMLSEGNRRKKYGQDVVIGYLESHNRNETEAQIGELEIISSKKIAYNSTILFEMDVETIILRNPDIVLIDELAHTNAPGSQNKKRYQDVEKILKSGIDVITTLNVQHLESLNESILKITGIRVTETIPDYIVQNADEVVVVDLTPDALQNRLKRGKIYESGKVDQALNNFFKKGNLTALRELALRETAEEVDEDLEEYMKKEGIKDNWRTVERIMVAIDSKPFSKELIKRAARLANRYKNDWYVVTVNCTSKFSKKNALKDKQAIQSLFLLAKEMGAETVTLEGKSIADELVQWSNEKHITQIFIGYPKRMKLKTLIKGSLVNKIIKKVKNIDIHLISSEPKL